MAETVTHKLEYNGKEIMKNSNIYLKAMYYMGNYEKKINASWI